MEKLTALTAYDYSFAKLFDSCGVDIILVGDSLGNTIKGCENTLCVSMSDMVYHTKNVAKGCKNSIVIADMPYLSYENKEEAIINAKQLIKVGADMVKIEGGEKYTEIFKEFTKHNIQVCGHLGLQPQSVKTMGYKVQGQSKNEAAQIVKDAILLENLGVKMLVLECIPTELAKNITEQLTIKTIGIGAGKEVDGQILVGYDILGITSSKLPKFVKNFAKNCGVKEATKNYIDAVKNIDFPDKKYSYS